MFEVQMTNDLRKHGITGEEPIRRYLESSSLLRLTPEHLPRFFRKKEIRKVKNDRSVKLDGQLFEAPLGLIGMQVVLRFDKYDHIEVFLDDKSRGFLIPLNQELNSRVKRESPSNQNFPPQLDGKLF